MQKMFRESRDLAVRHELDRLSPSSAISVGLAARGHLTELVDIARREIPGVNATEQGLAHFLQQDPESIFVFQRGGALLGGIAFLYLNCRGHDALLLEEIDLKTRTARFWRAPTRKHRRFTSGLSLPSGAPSSDWEMSRSI